MGNGAVAEPAVGAENAEAGVDYGKMKKFKRQMAALAETTRDFPRARRGVSVLPGGGYYCRGYERPVWKTVKEGVGNKPVFAEILLHLGFPDPTGNFHYGGLGFDAGLMAALDTIVKNALPAILNDEVSTGDSAWFETPQAGALAKSFYRYCQMSGSSLVQGESPTYRLMNKAVDPLKYVPAITVSTTGICDLADYITGEDVRPGHLLVGFRSGGWMSNGASVIYKRVMENGGLDGFLKQLADGRVVGQHALDSTRSYIGLVEAVRDAGIKVDDYQPVTGGGIAKIGADTRFHHYIDKWPKLDTWSMIFHHMMDLGVTKKSMAETFNCEVGWVAKVAPDQVDRFCEVAAKTPIDNEPGLFYEPMVVGKVFAGNPGTYFKEWDLNLDPP